MKKTIMLILCAGVFGLACLGTSSAAVGSELISAGKVSSGKRAGESVTPSVEVVPTVTSAAVVCARVVAAAALHLRYAPTTDSAAVMYLHSGEVVTVRDARDSAWWMVSRGDVVGYARAEYLQIVRCDNGNE